MRFLHTSDWHLGKFMNGKNLLEDQIFFLEQIKKQFRKGKEENNPYAALLIAGDIYDRQTPMEESTEVLSDFLYSFSQEFPEVHVFIISGNHDSAGRLSFAAPFFHKHNIHITTDTLKITEPVILENTAFYQLPYLFPNSLKSSAQEDLYLKKQQDLYKEACETICNSHSKNHSEKESVLVAHPFVLGNVKFGSERSSIGDTERVDADLFKDFTYCAFGHIHGYHVCDNAHRCFYSGAPLAYHSDDSPETFFLDVKLNGKDIPSVEKIPVEPLHPVACLEGKIQEFTDGNAKWKKYENSYVFISLTDEVSVPDAHARLKPVFPNLINVKPKDRIFKGEKTSALERKHVMKSKDITKIFEQFISDVEGKKDSFLTDDEKKLFAGEVELLKELARECNWGSSSE